MNKIIHSTNLTKIYGEKETSVTALDNINVEFKDFNSESSYEVSGLWESIDDAKGGPFKGYVFYDYKNDRTFYISYLVFNPGGKKAFYMRQLEMIAKTITVNS